MKPRTVHFFASPDTFPVTVPVLDDSTMVDSEAVCDTSLVLVPVLLVPVIKI